MRPRPAGAFRCGAERITMWHGDQPRQTFDRTLTPPAEKAQGTSSARLGGKARSNRSIELTSRRTVPAASVSRRHGVAERSVHMTTQESFKRRIRQRMEKTGERYGAARRALIAQSSQSQESGWVSQPDLADESLRAATGKGWDEWCEIIDTFDGRAAGHTEIATHVREVLGVDPWWAQGITVGYERIRGLRLPYQNHDGTFTSNRSQTIRVEADALRASLLDDAGREVLFPAFDTELRSRPTSKAVRLGVDGGLVEITLGPVRDGRTKVTVAHSKLRTADDVTVWKQFWTEWIQSLDADD